MDAAAAQRLAASPDPRGLAGLMRRSGDPSVGKAVAQQFGALFMQGLMQQNDGAAIPMTDGTGGGIVNSMFASTIGQAAMSGEKLGLADMLLRSIEKKQQAANGDAATATAPPAAAAPAAGGAAPSAGFPLSPYWQAHGLRPLGAVHGRFPVPAATAAMAMPATMAPPPAAAPSTGGIAPPAAASAGQAAPGAGAPPAIAAFAQQLVPLLQQAANQIGVSPRILLAQAALETGWGRSVVGNNVFGIKAGPSWSGASVTTPTHEYENGQMVAVSDSFRSYPSLDAAVRDFVSLIAGSQRYRGAIGAGEDAGAYARALLAGGWATDVDYAHKLEAVAASRSVAAAFGAPAAPTLPASIPPTPRIAGLMR